MTPSSAKSAVQVRQTRSGRWLVLQINGEMDIQADPLLAYLVDRDFSHVVFELHGVTFMDASGLRVLSEAQRHAAASHGGVRLVAPSRCVRKILTLSGADQEFRVYDTMQEAVSKPVDETGRDRL